MSEQLNNSEPRDDEWINQWNELQSWAKLDKFKENAAQELVEREFNSELTKVDDLKQAIESKEKGIAGGEVDLAFKDGRKERIYVILLKGYPFKTLQSDITLVNTNDLAGVEYGATQQTGETLRRDPSFWMKKKDEVEGLGKQTSAVFCASYYDTEVGVPELMGGRCSYGFDHVRPNTVVDIIKGDNNTTSSKDIQQPQLGYDAEGEEGMERFAYVAGNENKAETPPITLNELADVGHSIWQRFNEVVVNRYDELGNPQKPDYILTRGNEQNLGINSLTAKHALYHNVPLVCIVPEYYKEIKVEDDDDIDWDWDDEDDVDNGNQ